MTLQPDDVARLLASKERSLATQRFEHVAVANVRRDDADVVPRHQPVQPQIRHRRHDDNVDALVEREHRDDLISVDHFALRVDGEHAIAVAVERHTEVCSHLHDLVAQSHKVGGTAVDVDVRAVRGVPDRRYARAELLERLRRDTGVRTVRTVDDDVQTRKVRPEALDDVLQVGVGRNADLVHLAAAGSVRVEQRLDLFLLRVGELAAVAVEELDAVVLRRVVRRRDHCAEVEREQGDRGTRQHTSDHRGSTGHRDAACKRALELGAGCARVATDEDASATRPGRGSPAERFDELDRQISPDNPADAVCTEITSGHGSAQPKRSQRGRGDRALPRPFTRSV